MISYDCGNKYLKYRSEIINSHPQYSANASPVQLESAAFNRSSTQVSHVADYAIIYVEVASNFKFYVGHTYTHTIHV